MWVGRCLDFFHHLVARSECHPYGEQRQNDAAADGHRARRYVQQLEEEGTGDKDDHCRCHGRDHHAPADGALLLIREILGLFQERNQRDFGANPNQ